MWDMAPESERRKCETCGLWWFERHGHTCPEPYPYDVALSLVQAAQAMGGMIVHPRMKARIRMGLRGGS